MPAPEPAVAAAADEAAAEGHWRANRRLTASLLLAWFVTTFVVVFFARSLSFRIFGWPFSFWMAAQGSLVIYLLIVWWYARRMQQLDAAAGVAEDD